MYSSALKRKKIIFLGTPSCVIPVLDKILESEQLYQVILVITQPPANHHGKEILSPVHAHALTRGIPVRTPPLIKDPDFLAELKTLEPDLCITAAYGQFLPRVFLDIPTFGTLNVHPSLLPLYRGAAPVQRSIENGDKETGVSIVQTVLAMDAGDIFAQERFSIDPNIKSPNLLNQLFMEGARMLVEVLPDYFSGKRQGVPQDVNKVTKAAKLSSDESYLDFQNKTAKQLHDHVRAFFGWPSSKIILSIDGEEMEVKVLTTRYHDLFSLKHSFDISIDGLFFKAADEKTLEVLELQLPGKKAITAKDFINGFRKKNIQLVTKT